MVPIYMKWYLLGSIHNALPGVEDSISPPLLKTRELSAIAALPTQA